MNQLQVVYPLWTSLLQCHTNYCALRVWQVDRWVSVLLCIKSLLGMLNRTLPCKTWHVICKKCNSQLDKYTNIVHHLVHSAPCVSFKQSAYQHLCSSQCVTLCNSADLLPLQALFVGCRSNSLAVTPLPQTAATARVSVQTC